MLVVVEHPREELIPIPTTCLLRGSAEVAGLFGNGQRAVVGDAKFDSRDRVEVVLIRRPDLVDVLPLGVAPPILRVLHHRLVEAVVVDLRYEAESALEGLGVGEAGERREGSVLC